MVPRGTTQRRIHFWLAPGVLPVDLIEAATQRDIVLLLAVIVVALAGAVGYLFRLVVNDLKDRVKRAEHLTDLATAANDKLAALFEAALRELRGK